MHAKENFIQYSSCKMHATQNPIHYMLHYFVFIHYIIKHKNDKMTIYELCNQ